MRTLAATAELYREVPDQPAVLSTAQCTSLALLRAQLQVLHRRRRGSLDAPQSEEFYGCTPSTYLLAQLDCRTAHVLYARAREEEATAVAVVVVAVAVGVDIEIVREVVVHCRGENSTVRKCVRVDHLRTQWEAGTLGIGIPTGDSGDRGSQWSETGAPAQAGGRAVTQARLRRSKHLQVRTSLEKSGKVRDRPGKSPEWPWASQRRQVGSPTLSHD
eukprot:gene10652-biopygen13671